MWTEGRKQTRERERVRGYAREIWHGKLTGAGDPRHRAARRCEIARMAEDEGVCEKARVPLTAALNMPLIEDAGQIPSR
nr:hypothetical protein CFP56_16932 [Quercus suber]